MMKFLRKKNHKRRSVTSGIVGIPVVLALSILILALGVGLASMSVSESFISLGQDKSGQAFIYAEAGAKDALIRISRNKNYSESYSIDMISGGCTSNDGCATVTVGSGVGSQADPKLIDSVGRVGVNTRRLRVTVEYDADLYGKIATTTWQEVTN